MALEELIAVAGLLSVMVYGLFGGADFGGGIWDLFAAGPRRDAQRAAIAQTMGPIWEANHVWLILVIVLVFTAFPPAFAALSVALFGLFHFVLLGITLRGAAFVFRGPQVIGRTASRWGAVFGMASVITPVALGMAVGVISGDSIRLHNGHVQVVRFYPWLEPVPIAIGLLALSMCAYLAGVYLTVETGGALREDFRRRALLAGTIVVALSILLLPLLGWQMPAFGRRLMSRQAAPVLVLGVIAALGSGWALLRRRYRWARVTAAAQVALLLLGWGVAQYPYVIRPDLTLHDAAAPDATLRFLLYALVAGAAVLFPSLVLLFRVFHAERGERRPPA